MITMLLGGLWHGAGWTYVAWGGLHGLYLLANHAWRSSSKAKPPVLAAWGITMLAVITASSIAVWPTWPPLLTTWRVMPDYDYGQLLVPFIVVWIAARCEYLPRPATGVSPFATAALLASIAVWLVAY